MNKEEYMEWKESLSDNFEWNRQKCREADRLIKEETLINFGHYLTSLNLPHVLWDWTYWTVNTHFGSIEVDRLMNETGCYPSWI